MITLGSRPFSGPFLMPLWSAPQSSGLYAVMVAGWRLQTFRALHFGESADFSAEALASHPRFAEWLAIAGTEWNLYLGIHEMSFSTAGERQAAARVLEREYKPEFTAASGAATAAPSLKALLLARALREHEE